MKDYYKTLGLEKTATKDEIKTAFRKLAHQYHPDKNKNDPSAAQKFKEASEAYSTLSDDNKRKQYDMFGANGPGGAGFNPNTGGFGGQGGFGGFSGFNGGQGFGNGQGFHFDFSNFGGGQGVEFVAGMEGEREKEAISPSIRAFHSRNRSSAWRKKYRSAAKRS